MIEGDKRYQSLLGVKFVCVFCANAIYFFVSIIELFLDQSLSVT